MTTHFKPCGTNNVHNSVKWQLSGYDQFTCLGNGNTFSLHPTSEESKGEKKKKVHLRVSDKQHLLQGAFSRSLGIVSFPVSCAFSRSTDHWQRWGHLESFKGNNELDIGALWHFVLPCDAWGPDSAIARLVQMGNFFIYQLITQLWRMHKIPKWFQSRVYVGFASVAPSPTMPCTKQVIDKWELTGQLVVENL